MTVFELFPVFDPDVRTEYLAHAKELLWFLVDDPDFKRNHRSDEIDAMRETLRILEGKIRDEYAIEMNHRAIIAQANEFFREMEEMEDDH